MSVDGKDEDDWGKLKRVLKYLQVIKQLKLTIQPMHLDVLKWYVNAMYAMHDECKGHTGALVTLGQGVITCILENQN